jgi:hypothetical protein
MCPVPRDNRPPCRRATNAPALACRVRYTPYQARNVAGSRFAPTSQVSATFLACGDVVSSRGFRIGYGLVWPGWQPDGLVADEDLGRIEAAGR